MILQFAYCMNKKPTGVHCTLVQVQFDNKIKFFNIFYLNQIDNIFNVIKFCIIQFCMLCYCIICIMLSQFVKPQFDNPITIKSSDNFTNKVYDKQY